MEYDELGLAAPTEAVADWGAARDADPDYEALTTEIARMSSVSESTASPPDWKLVVTKGAGILSAKAKDIQVAAYFATGELTLNGIDGLSVGAKVLGDIFSAHAETAYPLQKRKRARLASVQWWLERAVGWFESNQPAEMEQAAYDSLTTRLDNLQKALDENFADEAPLLHELRTHVGRIPVLPPPPEPTAADSSEPEIITVEAVNDATPQTMPTPTPPTQTAAQPGVDPRIRMLALLRETAAASETMQDTPADPLPYRLRRLAAWADIKNAPPSEDGKSRLPPPDSTIMQTLRSHLDAGQYPEALRLAEEQVGVSLFWLDPHRISAAALAAMGAPYKAAQNAVTGEVRDYVARVPAIQSLAFDDGTPFADAQTKAWLAELLTSNRQDGGDGDNPAVRTAMEKAREQAAADPAAAVRMLSDAGDAAGRPKDALLLRIELMKILTASGHGEAAQAQIPLVLAILDKHALDTWDSPLTASALTACITALSDENDADRRRELRARLARAAPGRSLDLL